MTKAYLGLGANLGDPAGQIENALVGIAKLSRSTMLARSSLYRSDPVGPGDQPDYCNAVCSIETAIGPLALLAALQAIENEAGRRRDGPRWSARTLDLDILHFEGVVANTPRLTLPHPEIAFRNWVLVPLAEIEPALDIPGLGRIAGLADSIGSSRLHRWS